MLVAEVWKYSWIEASLVMPDKIEPIRAFEKQSSLARLLLFLYLDCTGSA
ncbi:MAG: hypothetical protein JRN15_23095 [Nitrososphaerota archaeon]|nr:hypothetical protein [Nitrososphaerota archaeon]